jgi:alpha-beta hydrolase superfamily lysophospholipase
VLRIACTLLCALSLAVAGPSALQTRQAVSIRGHSQTLYVFGSARGDPVIVSSGDGGWIHLAPHVAEFLGARGFYVIGFDTKAYLSSFTDSRTGAVRLDDEPGDYRVLTNVAKTATGKHPILIGVSEGAGLSVLAATAPEARTEIAGVIGLGLPDLNELGWRLRDSLIYVTHGVPKEPTFRVSSIIDRMSPLPIAAIHSTHDEFVPVADIERIMSAAKEPKRLWIINASNHRFSDNEAEFDRQLLDAVAWVQEHRPR